jgi:hypothetical protein
MKVNGSTVPFSYNSSAGTIVWIATGTQTSPVISPGAYTVSIEAGDYAGYKTSATWSFTAPVIGADASAPTISNKSPIGMAASDLPTISVRVFDNQSGIDPTSILLTLDGVVVVNPANIGPYYDPSTGTVTFVPSSPFGPGSAHTASISVNHCATSPGGAVNSFDTWGFSVP